MKKVRNPVKSLFLLISTALLLVTGCSSAAAPPHAEAPTQSDAPASTEKNEPGQKSEPNNSTETTPKPTEGQAPVKTPPKSTTEPQKPAASNTPVEQKPSGKPSDSVQIPDLDLEVVAEPQSITVLVNKQRQLPDNYQPTDLVFPNVPYLLPAKSEKRQMRKEAAEALEKLFAAAKADGVALAGVSAYRPNAYQKALFNRYVQQDGLEKARTYSAVPGTSEHETGLAIDVSGADGKCAATSCFAGTKEAKWLADHAHEYGFIIRYPEGKDAITGYMYEPWHLRYVGNEVAQAIEEKQTTLEEYFGVAPVSSEQ